MTFETYDCEMCVWSLMNEWLRMNVMAQQRLFKSSDSLWYFKEDCYLMIINAQTRFLSNACQGDSVPRVLNELLTCLCTSATPETGYLHKVCLTRHQNTLHASGTLALHHFN